jgi:hypothetical protein
LAITNQIPYLDKSGQLQLLGRSLRASATRLTDPYPQLIQRRRLEYFRGSLSQVDRLAAIGYGMADTEVNEIVCEWLAASPHRRLEIVNPAIRQLPPFLGTVAAQVELSPTSATTYFERFPA